MRSAREIIPDGRRRRTKEDGGGGGGQLVFLESDISQGSKETFNEDFLCLYTLKVCLGVSIAYTHRGCMQRNISFERNIPLERNFWLAHTHPAKIHFQDINPSRRK
jgi:hypothetical protein